MKILRTPLHHVAVLLAVLGGLAMAGTAGAAQRPCDARVNNTFAKLLACVTVDGVRAHLVALQAIADANGGTRVSGTPGYDASVAYVADVMHGAGYDVTVQPFMYQAFIRLSPSILARTAPAPISYAEGLDYRVMTHSDSGDVTAAVTPVDLQLGPGNASTSGCEAADFAGFPAGNIALLQRGSCAFQVKAENAAAAGAAGVIVFNQGDDPGDPERMDLFTGTVDATYAGGIPVVSAPYARGSEWAGTSGLRMRLAVDAFRGTATSYNVLAETRAGRADNVVVVGAHLDSVNDGPGLQDNGSGSAAILEVARQMAKVKPRNKVRFAWWGAEEAGLVGSDFYVASLTDAERDSIALYLNFDMIASPNYARFVYDGDGSAFGLAGPPGSAAIEQLFVDFYAARGLVSEPSEISFRSDYAAFFEAGIPIGGLFTGAEGIKSAERAAIYGGTAGLAFDPCYHQACDTLSNVNLQVLDLNADAIAHAVLQYAMNTSAVNGVRGRAGFLRAAPDAGKAERRGPAFAR